MRLSLIDREELAARRLRRGEFILEVAEEEGLTDDEAFDLRLRMRPTRLHHTSNAEWDQAIEYEFHQEYHWPTALERNQEVAEIVAGRCQYDPTAFETKRRDDELQDLHSHEG